MIDGLDFLGLSLEHPVVNASGTYDALAAMEVFGSSLLDRFPFSCYVTKTITVEPRRGNLPPRLWETPSGMINSIGLPNKGLEGFIEEDLGALGELPVPLMVSVAGFNTDEFKLLVERLGRGPVCAFELNISCPNVKSGCVYGMDVGETESLISDLRPITELPLVVKLTPNAPDIGAVASVASSSGADAISVTNTLRATAIRPGSGKPALGAGSGGLSGSAIKAVALQMVRSVREHTDLPIVGMGGISSGRDAYDFMACGASLVAVGTESFRDPLAAERIKVELLELIKKEPLKVSTGRV